MFRNLVARLPAESRVDGVVGVAADVVGVRKLHSTNLRLNWTGGWEAERKSILLC
jgi:hypothetical protein